MDEHDLKRAFDGIRMESALKSSTLAYVRKEMDRHRKRRQRQWIRWAAAAACMLLCVCTGWVAREYLRPMSVISIDINPSIELGVNALDRVVSVRGFNDDGERLTKELRLRFLPSTQAVERIVSSDTVTELLGQDEELFITVVGENEEASALLCQQLSRGTADVNAHWDTIALENVEEAHQCGFSYGKYQAYLAALEQEETLTAEAAREMTMHELNAISHHTEENHHGQEAAAEAAAPTQAETDCDPQDTHKTHGDTKHKEGHH